MNKTFIWLFIARGLAASVALAGAAYVAGTGNNGWGWLILAGIIIGTIDYSEESKE